MAKDCGGAAGTALRQGATLTVSKQVPRTPLLADDSAETPAVLRSARNLVVHYISARAGRFAILIGLVMTAAACAVGIQYVMKFLVDAMAQPAEGNVGILAIFLGLIAAENVFWRMSGWLGCRTTLEAGVQVRLDLFDYLASQPMRYFAENLAGSLGQRVTATAGNLGALINTSKAPSTCSAAPSRRPWWISLVR